MYSASFLMPRLGDKPFLKKGGMSRAQILQHSPLPSRLQKLPPGPEGTSPTRSTPAQIGCTKRVRLLRRGRMPLLIPCLREKNLS